MSRYYSYLHSAAEILRIYKGEEPFALFLKKYFSANKKFGSKDRKQVAHLCYCYFRAAAHPPKGEEQNSSGIEEKLVRGLFLCSTEPNEILAGVKPEWNEQIYLPLQEKCSMLPRIPNVRDGVQCSILNVFPWKEELSDEMDYEKFCESFLIQSDLFLRLRPGNEESVKRKLQQAGMDFKTLSETCLALSNTSKVDSVIELDKEAVIQDYNSQQIGEFLPVRPGRSDRVWDCCAGSGGKSIMAYDLNPDIEFTVSDVRENILVNLDKRFAKAGIKKYKSFAADLSQNKSKIKNQKSKIIIADLPCTGSGTWSRTPEQLYFFNHQTIKKFNHLQKMIISNVVPHLQPGGSLIYITCSVFKKENEEVVEFAQKNFHLQLKQAELLKGYDKKADSMYVAVLKKPL